MNDIHPTAIVHPTVILGKNVKVAPHAIIDAGAEIGDNNIIHAHTFISGFVRLGDQNEIGYGTIIGTNPQDLKFKSGTSSFVTIGNKNILRENITIHRGTDEGSMTTIGSENIIMSGTHIAHNCSIGNKTIIVNNNLIGGYCTVEDQCFLGGGCAFHPHIKIGRLALTQGLSAFSKNIPPFTKAATRNFVFGINFIGLNRAGFSSEQCNNIKKAFKLIYYSGLNKTQALAKAKESTWSEESEYFFNFIEHTNNKGICALSRE